MKDDTVLQWDKIDLLLAGAIEEDLGRVGDITTDSIIPKEKQGKGIFVVKEKGVIAGIPFVNRLFQLIDANLFLFWDVDEGMFVDKNQHIGQILGTLRSIFYGERIALNLLQRLSGIATLTSHFVQAVKGTRVKINDTRKTTPQLRLLEKYAVRIGGGLNHRSGLYDMVLIKDNHIDASGGISQAIENCLENKEIKKSDVKIVVETRTLDEVRKAIQYPIHRIMLDNMDIQTIREAIKVINHKIEIEVSGNISLESIGEVAKTGVDFISVGALTHSPNALDISLKMVSNK
ncbi:carboxylating nicotinate-nucleotide diphosphorylase [bacterium]|nr:carboxylating nicotinate-nucleotide diphosphorylase [bacterium]RQV98669.1 MAG: carboxylating nicotinate-nucleotide diphosphorylase [bacterium]